MKSNKESANSDADHQLKKKTIKVNREQLEAKQRSKEQEKTEKRELRRQDRNFKKELGAARKGERKYHRMVTGGRKFTQTRRK